jgi:hypothetical protein
MFCGACKDARVIELPDGRGELYEFPGEPTIFVQPPLFLPDPESPRDDDFKDEAGNPEEKTKTAKTMKVMIESSMTRVPKNMMRPELVRKIDIPGRRRERRRLTKIRIRRGRIYRRERFSIRGCMPEWTGRYVARPKVIGFLFLSSNSCSIVRSLPRQELRLF